MTYGTQAESPAEHKKAREEESPLGPRRVFQKLSVLEGNKITGICSLDSKGNLEGTPGMFFGKSAKNPTYSHAGVLIARQRQKKQILGYAVSREYIRVTERQYNAVCETVHRRGQSFDGRDGAVLCRECDQRQMCTCTLPGYKIAQH